MERRSHIGACYSPIWEAVKAGRAVLMGTKDGGRKNYGKLLRRIRLKRGFSVRQLAKEIGVDHTYISKVEHNKTAPPWGRMAQIAVLLESPELREVGEHAMITNFLTLTEAISTGARNLPLHLREKIGMQQIAKLEELCTALKPKLETALKRLPSTDWGIGPPIREFTITPTDDPVAMATGQKRRGSAVGPQGTGRAKK